jgi:hypothetical protein
MKATKFALAALLPMLILAGSRGLAHAAVVNFTFDPVNFFNYKTPPSGSVSTSGGMLGIAPSFSQQGTLGVYDSYDPSTSGTLGSIVKSLSTSTAYGIGGIAFQLFPSDSFGVGGSQAAAQALWGQSLQATSSLSSISGFSTPAGWYVVIDSTPDPDSPSHSLKWSVLYYTTNTADYIRPNNDVGNFGFTLANTNAIAGQNYTLFFNEISSDLTPPAAIVFPAGAGYAGAQNDSYYEATLLEPASAVPEPALMLQLLSCVGIGIGLASWSRRCKSKA